MRILCCRFFRTLVGLIGLAFLIVSLYNYLRHSHIVELNQIEGLKDIQPQGPSSVVGSGVRQRKAENLILKQQQLGSDQRLSFSRIPVNLPNKVPAPNNNVPVTTPLPADRYLRDKCTKLKVRLKEWNRTKSRILVNTAHNLAYCNVPKVGSSYWHAAFAILEGKINSSKSPDASLVENIQTKIKVRRYISLSPAARRNLTDNGYMFLFVRNPYQRLLSAYMNKFLSPNKYYWSAFGRKVVSTSRSKPSKKSKQCGHDVTLEEYLRYLFRNSESDQHWAPLYTLCSPCHYPYKFIGRLETFGQDALTVIKNANISHLITYDSNGDHQVKEYMTGRIREFVKYYYKLKHCLDFADTIRRLWDYFKFKGFIKYDSTPPFVQIKKFGNNTKALEADILERAYSSYTADIKKAGISTFGAEFIADAFSKVPAAVLEQIKRIYLPDFLLFGYDTERTGP